ncbi:conserved hypothetical protein [Ricinus communis]|uniref:Uncharacterized protein n=1 Tax=Ricinus communis TaxID=3988 RepID=B9SVR4_RICCO|nr:conserved hypothetical protein [Ricinus communis]
MEDSFKGMLKGMIQENNRKQEQPMQDPGKKHDQDFKKINKKQHHFMESPLLHQDHSSCNPHISKHAVEGTYDVYSTMRLIGEHDKKRELHILVDSGSTNNFLDLSIAQSLDCCKLTRTASPVAVSVANGEKEGEAITTDLEHEISEGDLDKLSLDFN